jgi:hypothetical protein
MKATLKYSIPEEETEFMIAVNSIHYYSVITDMDNYLRNIIKYNEEGWDEKDLNLAQLIRNKLHMFLSDHEVTIN